jgi:hypothetical protein
LARAPAFHAAPESLVNFWGETLDDPKNRIDNQFRLDGLLPVSGPMRVHVLVFCPLCDVWDETEWLQAAASNPAFARLGA